MIVFELEMFSVQLVYIYLEIKFFKRFKISFIDEKLIKNKIFFGSKNEIK